MLELAQQSLAWIAAHPQGAQLLLFSVALLDALFIVGVFVPASIFLFALGAAVALGAADLGPTLAIAASGALAGDMTSFWLGRRYGERLFASRPLRRYPEAVANGRRFFARHGGKGVFLARFMGPVRAVTPAVAGASGMSAWLFLVADGVAACLWAALYVMPGVVFGASLGLAAEVASRLASLLLLGALVIGCAVWITSLMVTYLQTRAERWLGAILDWSRQHRRLGRFGAALADPGQPETPALALIALLLIGIAGLLLAASDLIGGADYPFRVDALVYQGLHDLQTPWGNVIAIGIAQLGAPLVYLPVAVAVLIALLLRRKTKAAAHWIAALTFAALISLGLHAMPWLPGPIEYYHGVLPEDFGARDLIMVTVTYGFIPVLLSTQRPVRVRRRSYSAAAALLLLIVFARLYLGIDWASQALFALVVSLLWLFALGVGYRRHGAERVFARGFLWPVLAVFLAAAALRWTMSPQVPERLLPAHREDRIALVTWWNGGYRELPPRRIDLRGQAGPAFDLQWAGELPRIERALRGQGWETPPSPAGGNVLRWLTGSTPVAELAVLPQVHAGSHQALVLRRSVDAERQWLIRLWPSGWTLEDGRPIWLGAVSAQRAKSYYRLFRYPVTERSAVRVWVPPPPYVERTVPGAAGPLRLIAPAQPLYTAGVAEGPAAAPRVPGAAPPKPD